MDIAVYFGRNVRLLLRARGLNQTELAAKLGVSRQVVARMLDGKRPPNGHTLIAMAKALEVEACTLICKDLPV